MLLIHRTCGHVDPAHAEKNASLSFKFISIKQIEVTGLKQTDTRVVALFLREFGLTQ